MMDAVMLSRLQFAAATMFHFLFVPLTLGLSIAIAIIEHKYARTGDERYLRMTRFWGKLFLINFALGVVTGITLEFQFGTNFSRYSEYVGDVFGSLLAIEATAAFFLESTFIGVWIFGWKKLSAKAHARVIALVALASNFSALWILIANSWMQSPVGYEIRNGRAELTDFVAVVTQPWAILEILHTLFGAYILTGFFMMAVSAYHLLKEQHLPVFISSFKHGMAFSLIFSLSILVEGHLHASLLAEKQPAKLAAMESHWETARQAPSFLLAIPDPENERNSLEVMAIPGLLSFLAFHDSNSEVLGLKEFPADERPPILLSAMSFHAMVLLGLYFAFVSVLAFWFRDRLTQKRWLLKILFYSLPLPYIANQAGWMLAEVGRQPWIVYNLMKTFDSVSPISAGQVGTSLLGFVLVYGLLGAIGVHLITRAVKNGPLTDAAES
jgi:cytochrome d ubiquinol oxidase subunit I